MKIRPYIIKTDGADYISPLIKLCIGLTMHGMLLEFREILGKFDGYADGFDIDHFQ